MKKEILRPQSRFSMNSRIGATVPAANIWIGRIPRAQCLIRHPDQIQFHNWRSLPSMFQIKASFPRWYVNCMEKILNTGRLVCCPAKSTQRYNYNQMEKRDENKTTVGTVRDGGDPFYWRKQRARAK
jgi:hypothetical protein